MCTMPRFFTAICLTILFVASKSQGKQNWGFFTMHIISISAFESVNVPNSSLSWTALDWCHFKFFTQLACKRTSSIKWKVFFIDLWRVIGHSDSGTLRIAPLNHSLAPHYCFAHPFLGSWDSWFFLSNFLRCFESLCFSQTRARRSLCRVSGLAQLFRTYWKSDTNIPLSNELRSEWVSAAECASKVSSAKEANEWVVRADEQKSEQMSKWLITSQFRGARSHCYAATIKWLFLLWR